MTAVALGVLYSSGPAGVLRETVGTNLLASLPLSLVPTFGVPLALVIHSADVVDPIARPDEGREGRRIAWELAGDGKYQQVAEVAGTKEFGATLPYPVSVIPGDLVR